MTALLKWMTANPVQAFLAAGLAALCAMLPVPAAWLPGAVVAFCLLVGGLPAAAAAMGGATLACLWALAPAFGTLPALAVALALLLPALLAAVALEKSRSLSVAFQALTLGCCLLVLAINGLLGDPVRALAPVIEKLEPMLRQLADAFSRAGIDKTPEELGEQTASLAWATFGWMVLFNAFVAQCAALWGYGRLREPGLFGREFRALRLGAAVAWLLAALFVATLVSGATGGGGWQAADDLQFVLAAAFLVQALAVVHGLRELQVIGVVPLVLAYVAVVLVPMALVGIGFADTWVRFRERFAPRQGV
ncbi:MAG TPA: DUF2232 domain-containing protein [Steroidobacteraceae bacterium]|jgi:hypothetical protein|nr:DUF2232 domain-containing protein [Steroidobacteraceae bacterium]